MAWIGQFCSKLGLWEARFGVGDPPIEGLGGPDPRSGASDLAKMAKFGVPRQISPLGDRILVSKGGQNAVDLANLANFRDPSLEKVAEFWPRMGIGSPFLDPEGSANPEGP